MDADLAWVRDTVDFWRDCLHGFGRRLPTRDEEDAFFGRMVVETGREERDGRRLRILARCMAQLGRYGIDEVFPHFAEMYAQK
ncbi:hypothetical protein ACFV4X_26325 [Streptomyces ardesiacus]|uniref:hypothetical protein n=1 Tax=Streptomyces ardesiacus TaxID=285564 RepID=UPI0036534643